jgi:hypothetical protein
VIKAYVDKKRRQPNNVAGAGNGKAEVGAVWTEASGEGGATSDQDHLQSGRFFVDVSRKRAPLAVAAPGLH